MRIIEKYIVISQLAHRYVGNNFYSSFIFNIALYNLQSRSSKLPHFLQATTFSTSYHIFYELFAAGVMQTQEGSQGSSSELKDLPKDFLPKDFLKVLDLDVGKKYKLLHGGRASSPGGKGSFSAHPPAHRFATAHGG